MGTVQNDSGGFKSGSVDLGGVTGNTRAAGGRCAIIPDTVLISYVIGNEQLHHYAVSL